MDCWVVGWLGDQPGGFMGRSIHGGAKAICLIGWIDCLIDGELDGRMNGWGLVNSVDSVHLPHSLVVEPKFSAAETDVHH